VVEFLLSMQDVTDLLHVYKYLTVIYQGCNWIEVFNPQAVVPVRIGKTIVMVDATRSNESDLKTIGWLKTEVVQLFCLQLYNNNKSSGISLEVYGHWVCYL
jgi:hypothetical protein